MCAWIMPKPSPPPHHPWKRCLPRNWSLVPTRWGTAALEDGAERDGGGEGEEKGDASMLIS